MNADLVVRNARIMGRDDVVDLAADGGRWTRIGPALDVDARRELDAGGRLATPPLVDCHLHLDASLTAGRPRYNASGTLLEGIRVWGELKGSLTVEDVLERAREALARSREILGSSRGAVGSALDAAPPPADRHADAD